ncbi:MAG TPA: type VI secretion system protein TssA [Pirellulaceae bacterium]|nr:type VI secretion system protein TssA [Pirellulaceae bacterium]
MHDSTLPDIDSLLLPIPGDKPAGDATAYPYRLREKLGDLRVEERADDFDDATRPEQLKHADYPAIVKLAIEVLVAQTKDLRVACHLVEALTKTQGFVGLRQGLCLLRRLMNDCWDRLEPNIDDGDLDSRAAPIVNLLDDNTRGFCFPNTVRGVPVVSGQSVLSWQKLYATRDADSEKLIATTQISADPAQVALQKQNIDAALSELEALCAVLDERLQASSPSLSNLRKALEEAQLMAGALLPRTIAAPQPAISTPTPTAQIALSPAPTANSGSAVPSAQQITSARQEVYAQLTHAAATLAQLEPHSPIPYLVRRAVDLGKLPFPLLMQQLIREEHILADLQREFGLNDTASSSTATLPA